MKRLVVTLIILILFSMVVSMNALAEDDEEVEAIHVIVDNTDIIAEDVVDEFREYLYDARITEIYSVNNSINNVYYNPLAEDVPYLEESILSKGFISAYTGYFNLNHKDEFIPDDYAIRAVQVLEPDCLLSNEMYAGKGYVIQRIPERGVTKKTAVMSIYKALGLYQYSINYTFKPVTVEYLRQSPAAKNLPAYMNDVNPGSGRTEVFVTRTNPQLYVDKAVRDMKMSYSEVSDTTLTAGDFIVMCYKMMDFYGEPRMSEAEMNAVLQVYGAKCPMYLTPIQKEAYLYLAARGIINDDTINYSEQINLTTMLNILMCVKDKGSRSNFKEIQITMDINDTLKSSGYFPRTVNLVDNSDALQIDVKYDYISPNYYDYYVEKTKETTFTTKSGSNVQYTAFIPSTPGNPTSPGIDGFEYVGIERDGNNKEYYHFKIEVMSTDSDYMKATELQTGAKNMIQINSYEASDTPANMWFKQGGGIYTFAARNKFDEITLERRAFKDNEFKDAMSIERDSGDGKSAKGLKGFVDKIFNNSISTVMARDAGEAFDPMQPTARITIKNANTIDLKAVEAVIESEKTIDYSTSRSNNGTLQLTTTAPDYALSQLTINQSNSQAKSLTAISTIEGDTLISFQDLVDKGVLYKTLSGGEPQPQGDNRELLVLDSKYGRVVLNNEKKTIVVGSVMYHLDNPDVQLFSYGSANGLMVDFRCAYGWSANLCEISLTGDLADVTINVSDLGNNYKTMACITSTNIEIPSNFTTLNNKETALVLGAKGSAKYLMSSNYSLSNWMVYEGTEVSFLAVFYRRDVFESLGLEAPPDSNMQELSKYVGRIVVDSDWCVRLFDLSSNSNFTYQLPYGYIYNVPEKKDFTYEKYLKGEIPLPLIDTRTPGTVDPPTKLLNANVNYIKGYPYGNQPTMVNGTKEYQDIFFNKSKLPNEVSEIVVYATPAGVQSLFGGYERGMFTTGNANAVFSSISNDSYTSINFGTCGLDIERNPSANDWQGVFYLGKTKAKSSGVRYVIKFGEDRIFYNVAQWQYKGIGADGKSQDTYSNYCTRYVTYGSKDIEGKETVEETPEADNLTPDDKAVVSIVGAEREDEYVDFEEFKFQNIMDFLDNLMSFLIVFSLEVLPYIAMSFLTILLGLSYISDFKIVKLFCIKIFDPVRVLTLGAYDITQLNRKKIFIGVICGYCAFVMVLDGNFMRVLIWLSAAFDSFSKLLRM